MATLVPSACPYDCPDTCGLLAEVEGERLLAVRGDHAHPYSRGSLCPKMVHYERTVNHPDRLLYPQLRTGAKGEGKFRRATWDEAIELIAERWKELAAAHGAEAILPYSYAGTMGLVQRNAGHAFFHRLGASQLARTICSPAKDAGLKAIVGDTPGLDPSVVARGDLIVLWGVNAVATNLHLLPYVKEARKNGAVVWLIDTHRTATAAVVDRVFTVAPGSDGALCLGLIHLLARERLAAETFLAAEAQGWPELRAAVLADHPPARTAALTGLDEADLLELARGLSGARAPVIRIGEGLSRYGNGAMNVRSIAALAAVSGVMAKGGGFFWGASSGSAFALSAFTRPDFMARPTRTINMNLLGQALNELDDPRVMSICVYASNPAAVAPDQNAVLRGLAREDLFTVVHERFLTDTARFADVLLPATTSLEHADLYRSYGHYVVQRARPAIPPRGEALPNWELFRRLARAFCFEGAPFDLDADGVVDLLLDQPSPWLAGGDRAALDAGQPVTLTPPPGPRWRTPSGKVELLNPRHPEPLPRLLPTHAGEGTLPLRLQTGPALYSLNSTFMDRDDLAAKRGPLRVRLSPTEASVRGIADGARVVAFNELGEVAAAGRGDVRRCRTAWRWSRGSTGPATRSAAATSTRSPRSGSPTRPAAPPSTTPASTSGAPDAGAARCPTTCGRDRGPITLGPRLRPSRHPDRLAGGSGAGRRACSPASASASRWWTARCGSSGPTPSCASRPSELSCGNDHCFAAMWKATQPCSDCLPRQVFRTGQASEGIRERGRPGAWPEVWRVRAIPVRDASGRLAWVAECLVRLGAAEPALVGGAAAEPAGAAYLVVDRDERIVSWGRPPPPSSATPRSRRWGGAST